MNVLARLHGAQTRLVLHQLLILPTQCSCEPTHSIINSCDIPWDMVCKWTEPTIGETMIYMLPGAAKGQRVCISENLTKLTVLWFPADLAVVPRCLAVFY